MSKQAPCLQALPTELCTRIIASCDAVSAVRLATTSKALQAAGASLAPTWRAAYLLANCQPALFDTPVTELGFYPTDYDTQDKLSGRDNGQYVHGYIKVFLGLETVREVVNKMPDVTSEELILGLGLHQEQVKQVFESICDSHAALVQDETAIRVFDARPKLFLVIKLPCKDTSIVQKASLSCSLPRS